MVGRYFSRHFSFSTLLCFLMLFSGAQSAQAQDGERQLTGEVSTSNYRAPFGDDLEIFNLGTEVNSEFSEYNPVISPDAELMLFTTRNDTVTGEKVYDQDRQHFEDIHIARAVNGRYIADDKVDHPLTTFVSTVNSRKHEALCTFKRRRERSFCLRKTISGSVS